MTTVTCQHFDFADLLLQLRLMLKDMKEQKQQQPDGAIGTTLVIKYEGWCPIPPFDKEEVRLFVCVCLSLLFYLFCGYFVKILIQTPKNHCYCCCNLFLFVCLFLFVFVLFFLFCCC